MSILSKLATSLGRKDEVPNQELAKDIVDKADKVAAAELCDHLQNNKDKKIQSDCIKVLYEIGETAPDLIAKHTSIFLATLNSKNNRLVWGSMAALDTIASVKPGAIFDSLGDILRAMDKGSVITKDHGVGILIKLAGATDYEAQAFPLLIEQLLLCPSKQLPMYAERTFPIINTSNKVSFEKLLLERKAELEKDSQRKRIEKVLKKISKY